MTKILATQNPVQLEKISLVASKHKLDILFTDRSVSFLLLVLVELWCMHALNIL